VVCKSSDLVCCFSPQELLLRRSDAPDMKMARRGSLALSESSLKLAKLPRVNPKIVERIEVVCGYHCHPPRVDLTHVLT
jgi:hypothetical protein